MLLATLRVAFTGADTMVRVTLATPEATRLTGCLQVPFKQSPAKADPEIRTRPAIKAIKFFIFNLSLLKGYRKSS